MTQKKPDDRHPVPGTAGSLDPDNWDDLRAQGHRMLDDMLDYLAQLRDRPVWQPVPAQARAHFNAPVPEKPETLSAVYDAFTEFVLPYGSGNVHPRFMGWVQGGGTPVGMLADMLAAAMNANLGGRDHMPIEVEQQITRWLATLFGFPDTTSGLFVTGASMANFIGLLVARTARLGAASRQTGLGAASRQTGLGAASHQTDLGGETSEGATRQGLRAYTSAAAHKCVSNAMDMSGLGTDALRMIPLDDKHRMDMQALRAAVAADRKAGLTPFLVVGTAGTVDVGAIDDLQALGDFCRAENLWFHVDGAFGALGVLAPDIAPRLAGISAADSIALDFHKWGQVPYDAGFILVRDGAQHRAAFSAPAAYLRRETRGLAGGAHWPSDYGPDLSRGFRALKTWFTLKTYGTERLGQMISRTCALARYLESCIAATPRLELVAPANLSIVCFRYLAKNAAEIDAVNRHIVADLHEAGIAAPSTTMVAGKQVIRAAIFNHRTQESDIDALVEGVLAMADKNRF